MWKNCHIWQYILVESQVTSNAEGLDETTALLAKVYPFLKLSTDENSIIPQDHLHQGLAIFIISRFFLFISPFCELHPTTSWHLFGKYKERFIVFTFATTFPFFLFFFFSNHHASLPVLPQNKIRAKSFSPSPTPAESHQGWLFRLHLKTVPLRMHCSITAVMTSGLQHLIRALLCQWTLSTQL